MASPDPTLGVTMKSHTALRHTLLANGYSPLPIEDKTDPCFGWPTLAVTDAAIDKWDRYHSKTGTALRLENRLAVIDLDIDDADAIALVEQRVLAKFGWPGTPMLVRYGSGAKEAWFCLTTTPFPRYSGRSWAKPGIDRTHRVEIFGGGSPRYFGAFGPHTIDRETGEIKVEYEWGGRSPADVQLSDLTALKVEDFGVICDVVDEVMAELGYEHDVRARFGLNGGETLYDLTDDMTFDMQGGETLSLADLTSQAQASHTLDLRCSASFFEGPSAKNRTRCRIHSDKGRLTVYDFETADTHRPASEKPLPTDDLFQAIHKLGMSVQPQVQPGAVAPDVTRADAFDDIVNKMLQSYVFIPKYGALRIDATGMGEALSKNEIADQYAKHSTTQRRLSGGSMRLVKVNPAMDWWEHPDRTDVASASTRPDRPFPVFEEGGRSHLNFYRPPVHGDAASGSSRIGWAFLDHLVPDGAERMWFTRWLAHKLRYPAIPGPSVIMVADGIFGTGRGTMGRLMRKLFGTRYVREIDFRNLSGETSQAQYNDWLVNAVMILVDESSETISKKHQQRSNAYEALKRYAEPTRTPRHIVVKGKPNYEADSCACFFIATNHSDAISIPENDRRFAVLSNGERLTEAAADEVNHWMDDPANVAAFYADMVALPLGDYSPYAPPLKTRAKEKMAADTASDLDKALDGALGALITPYVTLPMVAELVEKYAKENDLFPPGVGTVERASHVIRHAKRRLKATGIRIMIGGERSMVWATTTDAVEQAGKVETAFVTRDVKRNNVVVEKNVPGLTKGLDTGL